MSLTDILEFILLPTVAWLLLNGYSVQRRLTRIETLLETILEEKKRK